MRLHVARPSIWYPRIPIVLRSLTGLVFLLSRKQDDWEFQKAIYIGRYRTEAR